jgi:hypothetical protein
VKNVSILGTLYPIIDLPDWIKVFFAERQIQTVEETQRAITWSSSHCSMDDTAALLGSAGAFLHMW